MDPQLKNRIDGRVRAEVRSIGLRHDHLDDARREEMACRELQLFSDRFGVRNVAV